MTRKFKYNEIYGEQLSGSMLLARDLAVITGCVPTDQHLQDAGKWQPRRRLDAGTGRRYSHPNNWLKFYFLYRQFNIFLFY